MQSPAHKIPLALPGNMARSRITLSKSPLQKNAEPFSKHRGYTIVELFLTLAVLMVVLGLMINVSNRVRRESADKITRQMLSRLTLMMAQYRRQNGQLPPVTPLIETNQTINESDLLIRSRKNNADFVRYLQLTQLASRPDADDDPLASGLHQTGSDPPLLEDPWGTPIVFMAGQNPAIGLPPRDAFFFFSTGPDRLFLTHQDNFYSYEETAAGEAD